VLNWVGPDSAGSHFDSLTSPNTGEALCGCKLSHVDKILPAAGVYTLLTVMVKIMYLCRCLICWKTTRISIRKRHSKYRYSVG
jgi:hypothetical protein